MSKRTEKSGNLAWRGTCATCATLWQCLYTFLVVALLALVGFLAYVATQDDIPLPAFAVRELREALDKKGIALRVDRVGFQPDGRVLLRSPVLRSNEFSATLVTADLIAVKINLPHLLVGRLTLEQIRISNGQFDLPPMLSPSGLPHTVLSSVELDAQRQGPYWNIRYANCALGELRFSAAGMLKESVFSFPRQTTDRSPLRETLINLTPRILALQKQTAQLSRPIITLALEIDETRRQNGVLRLQSDEIAATPQIGLAGVDAVLRIHENNGASLISKIGTVNLPQSLRLEKIVLRSEWPSIPTIQDWLPEHLELAADSVSRRGVVARSLTISAAPSADDHSVALTFDLADHPLSLQATFDDQSKLAQFYLDGALSPKLPSALSPSDSPDEPSSLEAAARLGHEVDLSLHGSISEAWPLGPLSDLVRRTNIFATLQSGPATILGAAVDRANIKANLRGPAIDVEQIRIRSGPQAASIRIGYNLDTLFRRILVEGNVDPTMINGWFKPWWSSMWEGMEFPEEGLYAALDSQGTFKQPDSTRVTGIGHARNVNIRGLAAEDLRLRFFALFHYVDLYDIELKGADAQAASGEVQFAMAKDLRDDKDKLTGLWIDADSTLDVSVGPQVLREISESVARILAPYQYNEPPHLGVRASSVRRDDRFEYDVDLEIDSPGFFAFHKFPFESVKTSVHLQNEIADIPNVQAKLGGGELEASVFIRGEDIQIAAELSQAGFGETLLASNTYLAAGGSSNAQANDPERFLNYGGKLDAHFAGAGLVGDPHSFFGNGAFSVSDADLGRLRMLGLLSAALEVTPLRLTTLRFSEAEGAFEMQGPKIALPDIAIDGPVASIRVDGAYHLDSDSLDLRAKLFPFRNSRIPIISPLVNVALQPFSYALEIVIRGTFAEPRISLFDPSGNPNANSSRDPRPARP